MVVPTGTYGAENGSMRLEERQKLDVMEMKRLRSVCGVTRMERWRGVEVRRGESEGGDE